MKSDSKLVSKFPRNHQASGAKKQDTVALLTGEAVLHVDLSSSSQKFVWMRRLNPELNNPPEGTTTIHDNLHSAIEMAKNQQFHKELSQLMTCDIIFVREQVHDGTIQVKYSPTCEIVADILTKGLVQQ